MMYSDLRVNDIIYDYAAWQRYERCKILSIKICEKYPHMVEMFIKYLDYKRKPNDKYWINDADNHKIRLLNMVINPGIFFMPQIKKVQNI